MPDHPRPPVEKGTRWKNRHTGHVVTISAATYTSVSYQADGATISQNPWAFAEHWDPDDA